MVDYQTISIVLTGIGMIIAITYYALQIRNQNRTRQAQMFMQIFQQDLAERGPHTLLNLLDWEFKDAEEFDAKYGRDVNPEAYRSYEYLLKYYEGMGVMVREGYIDIRLIALMDSGGVKNMWEKFKPLIYEERERHSWPRWSVEFEYLYDTLMDYAEKHPDLQI